MPGHTKCCACPVMQNHLSKPEDLMLQNAAILRKSAPWPPNISDEHVFVPRLPRELHLCRSSSNVPRLPSFLEMLQNPHVLLTFGRVQNPLRLPHKTTLRRPKVARTFFLHSDFDMCCAPQRTLFEHLNFQKVIRTRQFLTLLTSKCASRHNGVQFFISHLPRWLRTRFSEPTFRPFGATNQWKNTVNRDLSTSFAHLSDLLWSSLIFFDLLWSSLIFFDLLWPSLIVSSRLVLSLLFSSLLFSSLLSSSLLFSSLLSSPHLFSCLTLPSSAFPYVHIVGSLTSKLPSANRYNVPLRTFHGETPCFGRFFSGISSEVLSPVGSPPAHITTSYHRE